MSLLLLTEECPEQLPFRGVAAELLTCRKQELQHFVN